MVQYEEGQKVRYKPVGGNSHAHLERILLTYFQARTQTHRRVLVSSPVS